ncbi:RDD family protein [Clostridium omnivorum]|uniref:RDD domain-containing protein n=1 Tax=Clostridium omnivorum TaxID=1604902 RepID=A0ABQ5N764_9CLOT|nr:RDD family protein [Clostridium sp. E14]GLC31098.1 hypothetical protein bsdE14_25080 [Clostridium sp. E14]
MQKIKITTPENIEVEYTLADLGSRTAAALIDSFIQLGVLLVLLIAVLLLKHFAPGFWEEYYGWIVGISLIVAIIIGYCYFIFSELTMNGKTIGKKALKLRTIRKNGQPVTFKHSAIRNLFRLFIDYYGVGVVVMFFNKQHKRVGDLLASTVVVTEDNKEQPITLESLQNVNENYSYYLDEEEKELLRDYFQRRESFVEGSKLSEDLKQHFTNKFDKLGVLDKFQDFINKL